MLTSSSRPYPKRSLGQNFLIDPNISKKMVSFSHIQPHQLVVEIGAGAGALTEKLLESQAEVFAIEIDKRCCQILKQRFAGFKNFHLEERDILSYDIAKNFAGKRITLIGNLPFNISSQIIIKFLPQGKFIEHFFITVQKELAQRMTSASRSRQSSAFGLYVQFFAKPEILFTIKRTCFKPTPKVDAAFMALHLWPSEKIENIDRRVLFRLIHAAFNFRRKTIFNALRNSFEPELVRQVLKEAGIEERKRPEAVGLEDYIRLAHYFREK